MDIGNARGIKKIDIKLTKTLIIKICGSNLENIDPQTKFYRPSAVLGKLFTVVGKNYNRPVAN